MDFTAGHRETITEVYAGDLVIVRLEHQDGKLMFDGQRQLPHLVYKPYFAGQELPSRRRQQHVHGDETTTPEWHLDIGPLWIAAPGILAIEGGGGKVRFRVFYTVAHCRPDPGLEHTLSFYRVDGAIERPRGASHLRVEHPTTVRLSSGGHFVDVLMQPGERGYPVGFATTVEPLSITSLFFRVVL